MPCLRLGSVFIRAKWSLAITIALPVAPATAPAAPAATPTTLARLAFPCGGAFRSRLRMVEIVFFGRAFVILVSNCMGGASILRDLVRTFTWFAAASTAAAPAATPAPPRPVVFACFATLLAFRFSYSDLGIFSRFAFGRSLALLEVFDRRWCQLRLLGGKIARGLRCMHLFATIDHVRLLAGYRRIG